MGKRPKIIAFRRKREGKTDYRLRLKLAISGKPRLVIRRTNKHIITQIVQFQHDGDKVLITATTAELKKHGWNSHSRNMPAAYLAGLLCGTKAKKAKIPEAIADLGLNTPKKKGMFYATVKGAVDAGLNVPHNKEILPSDDRISGKHIAEYAKKLSANKTAYDKQFSKYIKMKAKPEDLQKQFESTKASILKVKQ